MPMYDFVCQECKLRFEELVKNSSSSATCPHCGKPINEKLFPDNTAFMLKGTGWYATDYKKPKQD